MSLLLLLRFLSQIRTKDLHPPNYEKNLSIHNSQEIDPIEFNKEREREGEIGEQEKAVSLRVVVVWLRGGVVSVTFCLHVPGSRQ